MSGGRGANFGTKHVIVFSSDFLRLAFMNVVILVYFYKCLGAWPKPSTLSLPDWFSEKVCLERKKNNLCNLLMPLPPAKICFAISC